MLDVSVCFLSTVTSDHLADSHLLSENRRSCHGPPGPTSTLRVYRSSSVHPDGILISDHQMALLVPCMIMRRKRTKSSKPPFERPPPYSRSVDFRSLVGLCFTMCCRSPTLTFVTRCRCYQSLKDQCDHCALLQRHIKFLLCTYLGGIYFQNDAILVTSSACR